MTKGRYNRKGFSLAEAMMAVVLLAMAASAVSLPFMAGANVRAEGARRTVAAKLAHDRVEQIVSMDFDGLLSYDGYFEFYGMVENANGEFFTDPIYSKFIRITNVTPATVANVNLLWVTVSIYYNTEEMIHLSTLVGR
jgi:prepilin-type N-terminal cleavage/methylation domain-containing protein